MRVHWLEWCGARDTARAMRRWFESEREPIDVEGIENSVIARGDSAVLEMTAKFDMTDALPTSLRVDPGEPAAALEALDPELREALEIAAANIDSVARAQVSDDSTVVRLPQGQSVELRDVAVASAAIYAPGGTATYPSSVLMGCLAARAAGVKRIALTTPPRPDGSVDTLTLAAAALCEVDEVYAMGGAQAIFALAHGTETVEPVDVIAGPGNRWVTEAKRSVFGLVGIDSLAGPSELLVIPGREVNLEWLALDLCAQAEHGIDSPLIAAGPDRAQLERLAAAVEEAAPGLPSVAEAGFALVETPDFAAAADLVNAVAPEHLQLAGDGADELAGRITTAGCVFVGENSATAFGDYAAGSNHVLPTGGTGRFSGPLGPGTFRRRIASVEITPEAAAELAPVVAALSQAETLPVHGQSAMARIERPGGESEAQ